MTRNIGNFIGASPDNGGVFTSLAQQVLRKTNIWGDIDISGGTPHIPGNGYRYHVFGSTGTLTVNSGGSVDVLVIAGGGGGGASGTYSFNFAGGGGAGGFVQFTTSMNPGVYTITVGGGGASDTNGSNSSIVGPPVFVTVTANGGGYGGSSWGPFGNSGLPANSGGSGGGACKNDAASTGGASGNVPSIPVALGGPQGNPGGNNGGPFGSDGHSGGGGGGAGGAGMYGGPRSLSGMPSVWSEQVSAGGLGRSAFNGDTGLPGAYGTSGPGPGRYFAGGGGGGSRWDVLGGPGNKSQNGGGGNGGGRVSSTVYGKSAILNTGGGGGGSGYGPAPFAVPVPQEPTYQWPGGSGGSGIVIIRYLYS